MKPIARVCKFTAILCGSAFLLFAAGARAQEAPAGTPPSAPQGAGSGGVQAGAASGTQAAPPAIPNTGDFQKLSTELAYERSHSLETIEKTQDAALAFLDAVVLAELNGTATPDLDALNARLATLVAQKASSEYYRVARVAGTAPLAYVLAANFGPTGPSAVRVYAKKQIAYSLAGRIDRFSQPDLFDDYLVLAVLENGNGVFVTATGRTDDLATGMFGAWRQGEKGLEKLWLTELLVRSSYRLLPDGIEVTYCGAPSEEDPVVCRQMVTDHFGWNGRAWARVSQTPTPGGTK
jgi:hypothetical protein